MGDSGSGSWVNREVDEHDAEEYMRYLRSIMTISNEVRISGGLSGADVRKVIAESHNHHNLNGQFILKICLAEDATQEIIWHEIAQKSRTLGRKHVPDRGGVISYKHLSGIFYRVAGRDVHSTRTLASHYEETLYLPSTKHLTRIASGILGHNLTGIDNPTLTQILRQLPKPMLSSQNSEFPQTLIAQIGYWMEDYRLDDLSIILGEILNNPHAWQIVFSHPFDAVWRLNPFPFVHQPTIIPQDGDVIGKPTEGLLHGDLHPGNLIVPIDETNTEDWYLIDFAAGRKGNAFSDLAFLEHSIVLSLLGRITDSSKLPTWWEAERRLHQGMVPSSTQGRDEHFIVRQVLPIRQVLDRQARRANLDDEYFTAYLLASIEAGLRLTRILRKDEQRRLIAFLTAASRFHQLIYHRLEVGYKYDVRSSSTNIKWRAESMWNGGRNRPTRNRYPVRPWPQEVWDQEELYDPYDVFTDDLIAGLRNLTGIAVIGERRSGKSSFVNVVQSRLKRRNSTMQFCRVPTLGIKYTASQFAGAIWQNILAQLDTKPTSGGLVIDARGQVECDDRSELPVLLAAACNSALAHQGPSRFVLLVDELDSVLKEARSTEDARLIVEMISRVVKTSPVTLCLTASNEAVIRTCSEIGDQLLDDLTRYRVPEWSNEQISEFIQHLDLGLEAHVHFSDAAVSRVGHYSGWQISVAKLVGLAVASHPRVFRGEEFKRVSDQLVDESMEALAHPERNVNFHMIDNLHHEAWKVWNDILKRHFDAYEREIARQLASAQTGIIEIDSIAQPALLQGARSLTARGYLTRMTHDHAAQRQSYSWRIGFWQLIVEDEVGRSSGGFPNSTAEKQPEESPSTQQNNDVQATLKDRVVHLAGVSTPIQLTEIEAKLLQVAIEHGMAPTFREISSLARDITNAPAPEAVQVYLARVKAKLEIYPAGKGIIVFEGDRVILRGISL